MDVFAFIGIGIELIDGEILICFRDVDRCGNTNGVVLNEEPYCVQLIFARVLCRIAVLALRPDDGNIIDILIIGSRREVEVGADIHSAETLGAFGEACVNTSVGVDTCHTDVVRLDFVLHVCIILGVPADEELITDCSHLHVGIGAVVIGQTSGRKRISVFVDQGVEGFCACRIFAGADSVDQDRSAVTEHSGVNGVDCTGSTVVGDLCVGPGNPGIFIIGTDSVIDVVLCVEHSSEVIAAAILRHL